MTMNTFTSDSNNADNSEMWCSHAYSLVLSVKTFYEHSQLANITHFFPFFFFDKSCSEPYATIIQLNRWILLSGMLHEPWVSRNAEKKNEYTHTTQESIFPCRFYLSGASRQSYYVLEIEYDRMNPLCMNSRPSSFLTLPRTNWKSWRKLEQWYAPIENSQCILKLLHKKCLLLPLIRQDLNVYCFKQNLNTFPIDASSWKSVNARCISPRLRYSR